MEKKQEAKKVTLTELDTGNISNPNTSTSNNFHL